MTCSEFVEGFSEYYDGTAATPWIQEADDHLSGCPGCRRYRYVMERGVELLQALPTPPIREDFGPRLQHRIYHVDEEGSLDRHTTSGTTGLAIVGMALLLTAVAWSPALRPSAPTVELEPIVVSGPPQAYRARRPVASFATGWRQTPRRQADVAAGLWDDAHALMFEYSQLSQRYGRSALQHSGLEQDR